MIFPFVDKFDLDLHLIDHLIDLHSDYVTLQGKGKHLTSLQSLNLFNINIK